MTAEVWVGFAVVLGVIALIALVAWRTERGYRSHCGERWIR